MELLMSNAVTLRIGVLTVSDRSAKGVRPDASGPALEDYLKARGWQVAERLTVPDEMQLISQALLRWAGLGLDIILTTGGTGFSSRDVTPEATRAVIEKEAPGLTEAMRLASLQVTPHAMLSRAVAGIKGKTLIVNLPGSPKAALENLEVILPVLPHAVELMNDDPHAEAGHAIKKN
jgi:molybdopterin adenylyltransferase